MKRFLILVALSGGVGAQPRHSTLSAKQAETLALNAPPTLRAAQGKCCPDAVGSETPAGSGVAPYTLIAVQVRCGCGEYTGQLIDNYMVNPRNGQIWEGLEETGKPFSSKRLNVLRQQMFKQNSK
jgi:hypothetical protein